MKVKYLVSDRAKAIIKLALNDLGTNSISDLFHVLYDLNRSIGFELNCLSTRLSKQIQRALQDRSKPEIINELELINPRKLTLCSKILNKIDNYKVLLRED